MKHLFILASNIIVLVLYMCAPAVIRAESYIDLTLDQAISLALEKNRDINDAREETIRSDFQITEAASSAYPQINGLWSLDKNLKPQVFVISFPDSTGKLQKNRLKVGTDHSMNLGANLTQPLYVGGKVGIALKAAKVYRNISYETLNSIKQNVVMGVSVAFNEILLASEIVKITEASLAQAQRHLKNVDNLHQVGRATDYDLLRARVNMANIKPQLVGAENDVHIALFKLTDILGISPETQITIDGAFSEPDTSLFDIAYAQTAFNNRPDLRATEQSVELQEKAVQIARGDFLPTVTAGTTFAYVGNFDAFEYNAEDWNPYWFANITLSFPIFSGFKNYAKFNQAKVDYRKAQINLRKTRDSIMIEVNEGVMNLRKALEQIESQRMTVTQAEEAEHLAESLYTSGKATQLEVLDAQLALDTARINLASALFGGKVAEVTLKKSLGLLDFDDKERD